MFNCKIVDKNNEAAYVDQTLYAGNGEWLIDRVERNEDGRVNISASPIDGTSAELRLTGAYSGSEYPTFDDFQLKMFDKLFDFIDDNQCDVTKQDLICCLRLDFSRCDECLFVRQVYGVHIDE